MNHSNVSNQQNSAPIPQEISFLAQWLLSLLVSAPSTHSYNSLKSQLSLRYLSGHWHFQSPERGSGFRAISYDPVRGDGYIDPVLVMTAASAGVPLREAKKQFAANSNGWTLWCDPGCVSIRYFSGTSNNELRELWGTLPKYLSPTISFSSKVAVPVIPPGPATCKSRAIPILAPSCSNKTPSVVLALKPSTPLSMPETCVKDDVEVQDQVFLSDITASVFDQEEENGCSMSRPFTLPTQFLAYKSSLRSAHDEFKNPSQVSNNPSSENPFQSSLFRPPSSCSSSDGSDSSFALSVNSTSTNATTPPLGLSRPVSKSGPGAINQAFQTNQICYFRHKPASSMPFSLEMPQFIPQKYTCPNGGAPPSNAYPRRNHSSALVAPRRQREGHYSSSSVSSTNSVPNAPRFGGLVLKEGPGTVTEHSGGKVGVMGGGVLLGLPKSSTNNDADASSTSETRSRRRGGRRGKSQGQNFSSQNSITNNALVADIVHTA